MGGISEGKIAKAGWHTTKSEFVDAPLIDELPTMMECRLMSYDPESCRLMGEIVNVGADESMLDEAGKIDPGKLRFHYLLPHPQCIPHAVREGGNAFHDSVKLK